MWGEVSRVEEARPDPGRRGSNGWPPEVASWGAENGDVLSRWV